MKKNGFTLTDNKLERTYYYDRGFWNASWALVFLCGIIIGAIIF